LSRDVPRGSGHGRHPRGLGPLAVTRPTPPLTVRIGSLALRNPVLVASGIIGYGVEYDRLLDLSAIGGIVTKTVTRHPRAGNPPPRVVETPSGMLNSIGIENPGLEGFLEIKAPILSRL